MADDAVASATLFAVDPVGLGGVCLRSLVQPARTDWLQMLRDLMPAAVPIRRIPFNITDGRLLGGLDLVATLRANRPIAERGVLAATDGGIVVVAMAERLTPHTAACLNSVMDSGQITLQREGVQIQDQARVGVVALDESMEEDERVAASLLDRLAFLVDLSTLDLRTPLMPTHEAGDIEAARRRLPGVTIATELVNALCGTAMTLGAGSPRVSLLAVNAARAAAALDNRTEVCVADATLVARLVFAPRATRVPAAADPVPEDAPADSASREDARPEDAATEDGRSGAAASDATPPAATEKTQDTDQDTSRDTAQVPAPTPSTPSSAGEAAADADQSPRASDRDAIDDIVLTAAEAAIPAGLLACLRASAGARQSTGSAGRTGVLRNGGSRGRSNGVRSGIPQGSVRLNLMETLRAAAPWQRLRGRAAHGDVRVRVEPADFRVTRYQQRAQTLTIFAVDASGSSALNRLAEAKGAVELLLADCYVRRDQVAVVTFRGRAAEVLLAPTRSLVRAKRGLAGLPGGGGTPLAAGIQCAMQLAVLAQRRGDTPTLVILTDGRANVARNGLGGREAAQSDALKAARQLSTTRIRVLFVDTSPRPNPLAETLAGAMHARYIPLPFANAKALSSLVTAATPRAAR